jgi:pimeloyl-ACP methyl ester carboxylesterase
LGRNDYQQESTVLWEYLASHGYVVATVPQFGPDLARHGLSFTLEDLGIQQRDVSFALSHVRRLPYVDARHVGVVGHSSGGVVGLLLASENTSVAALVSLDGSITTEDGRDLLAQASWDPRSMRAPVLNVYAAEKRGLTFSVLDSLVRADRYHVTVDRATHFDFQNWPLYAVLTGVPDPRGESVRPSEHGRDVYVAAARLTRHFFDAVLKGDDRVLKALKAEEVPSFVPDGLVQVQYTGSGSH